MTFSLIFQFFPFTTLSLHIKFLLEPTIYNQEAILKVAIIELNQKSSTNKCKEVVKNNFTTNKQERQLASSNALGNLSLVNVAANTRSSNSCSYCCRDNHTVETCYKKNGFRPNFLFNRWGRGGGRGFGRGGIGGKSTNGKVCTHCGITNHTADECYKKHC